MGKKKKRRTWWEKRITRKQKQTKECEKQNGA
jgi:hypothetical protein